MGNDVDELADLELLLIEPAKNRFRLYAITACRTLFGEQCLRIVWGRLGNRQLQERSELFEDRAAMVRRRAELVRRRHRHGYAARGLSPATTSFAT